MKSAQTISNFNSGELSPLMEGRLDLKYYVNSCRRMRNFVPSPQGPVRRRPGTRYVTKKTVASVIGQPWLAGFIFSDDQAYVIEFGDLYCRFYSNHGVVESSPGVPLVMVTPYSGVDLTASDGTFALRMVQSGDVLYVFHRSYPPQKITRTGASAFSIAAVSILDGPFKSIDPANTVTIYSDAIIGSVTLTASAATFIPNILAPNALVGSLILLETRDADGVKSWEPGKTIFPNEVRRSDGKVYKAIGGFPLCAIMNADTANNRITSDVSHNLRIGDPWVGKGAALPNPLVIGTTYYVKTVPSRIEVTLSAVQGGPEIALTTNVTGGQFDGAGLTGSVKPVHYQHWKSSSTVDRYDGDGGVLWRFFDPGYGWAKIDSITSSTVAVATVISRLPESVVGVGGATPRWAFSPWNILEGHPTCGTFFRERLCVMRDRDFWASVAADFESFADRDPGGLITADMGIVANTLSDRADPVKWMAPSQLALLIGTGGDESALMENVSSDPFGPGNAAIRKQTEYGSRGTPILKVGDGILFVQKSGRKIRDIRMAESVNERWTASDMTILAEHITKSGIVDITYQQEPDSLVWAAMANGDLAGFTLNHEQDIRGWHPHRIGGYSDAPHTEFAKILSVVSIPMDGRDEIWMLVKRNMSGTDEYFIEYMEKFHEEGDDPHFAFYVDSGLTFNGSKNVALTPHPSAVVAWTTGVAFVAGGAVFAVGDVGKYIHYRYSTRDVKGKVQWLTAIAKITDYIDPQNVQCTVIAPWPSVTLFSDPPGAGTMAANSWRMTATVISGLSHLEGQTVDILADGAVHPQKVVSGGSITLDYPASLVNIGLPCPAVLQPMPISSGSADGSTRGKTKRASRVAINFHETGGCRYGRDEDKRLDTISTRGGGDVMDQAVPLFTGEKIVSWPDGYDSELLLTIVQDQPLPCTVVAITPKFSVEEDR